MKSFGSCLAKWSSEIVGCLDFYQVNIDGKVLRATAKEGKKESGLCLISAWVSKQNVSLGQLKTSAKSNEKTAIPELIADLDIKNALVSIDAIACSMSVASQIVEKEADYLLALKKTIGYFMSKSATGCKAENRTSIQKNTLILEAEE